MMAERRKSLLDDQLETLDLRQGVFANFCVALEGSSIQDILVNHDTHTYTVLQYGVVSLYQEDRLLAQHHVDSDIMWLLFVTRLNKYAAFTSSTIKLLDKQFQCTFESVTPNRIISAVYNECSGDVVTTGPGNITSWMFRQGGRVINPRDPITAGFNKTDEVSHLHLEQVPGKAQKSFVVVGYGVKVHWLQDGLLMADLVDLHSRPITSVYYFRPMRLLITAADDGSIKVWDGLWRLCSTFVGHRGMITCLAPYAHLPCIMSGSMDATIRVWNLETLDQVEKVKHKTPVLGLAAQPESDTIISHSDHKIYSWNVHKFLLEFSSLGCAVSGLAHTTHPTSPRVVVATTEDAVVRLVSPVNGHIITTALLPVTSRIVSVATAAHTGILYVLLDDGDIHVMDYSTNPCTLKETWSTKEYGLCSCVTMYESVLSQEEVENVLKDDHWLAVKLSYEEELQRRYPHRKAAHNVFEGKVLLLAGTCTGNLLVLNQKGGGADVCCCVQAHENCVTQIANNPKADQVISAGEDDVIKVWQVYPNVEHDILSPLMTFLVRCQPSHILATKHRLCVSTNQPSIAAYNISLYNLMTNSSYTHDAISAHTDVIRDISCCEKLQLFVSCSADTTVRLWNDHNILLRVIHIGGIPSCVTVSSECADLVMAMNETLFGISHSTYLPDACMLRLVGMRCASPVEQSSLPYHTGLGSLPPSDAARLEKVQQNKERLSFRGVLSEEELIMLEKAAAAKAEAMSQLQKRDTELKNIRDGLLTKSKKSTGLTARNKDKAWKQLLDILRPRKNLGIHVSDVDDFDPDGSGKISSVAVPESKFVKSPPRRFFPPLSRFEPPYPIAPDCHLPNSAVLQQIRKFPEDQEAVGRWKPALLTANQLEQLKKQKEEEILSQASTITEDDTDYKSRLRAALEDPLEVTPPPTPTPPSTPSPSPSPPPMVRTPPKIEKLIAPKAPPKKPPTPPPPPKTPTPPPCSPTPPPPTPLPEYIAQFIGQKWFDQLFPGANSKTFPKPWTIGRFVETLLENVNRCSDLFNKYDLYGAVLMLYTRHDIPNRADIIANSVTAQLEGPPHLSPSNRADKQYMRRLLELLKAVNVLNGKILSYLMSIYITSDQEFKDLVLSYLLSHGLEDPEGYFIRTLEDWSEDEEDEGGALGVQKSTSDWLLYWKEELTDGSSQTKKAATPTKKTTRSSIPAVPRRGKGKAKKEKEEQPVVQSLTDMNKGEVIDLLNFFVKVQHQKYLDWLASSLRVPSPVLPVEQPEEEELLCNTVIALPKITRHRCLARLGETHHSKCHPQRETSLALVKQLPRLQRPGCSCPDGWRHFTHQVTLATKTQLLDPFNEGEETKSSPQAPVFGLSKYFIPENSYVKPMR